MFLNNQKFARLFFAGILLLAITNLCSLGLSIHDIFYLRKIISNQTVPESAHNFFSKKNEIEYWVSRLSYLVYMIIFLTWFFRSYKNVYIREADQAPFKPIIVPFSYIIPIFNFYGPYQIMKFIWWGNAHSVDHLYKGFKVINAWWFLSILTAALSRYAAFKYSKAVYANEFITPTYNYIVISILSIFLLALSYWLVQNINKEESSNLLFK